MSYKLVSLLMALSLSCLVSAQESEKRSFAEREGLDFENSDAETLDPAYGQVFVVTDEVRGFTISLENLDGHTIITNLETGEKILEEGEFAQIITDEKYSQILLKKEQSEQNVLTADGSWRLLSTGNKFQSPNYYFNGGANASIEIINAYLDRINGQNVGASEAETINLWQVTPWWSSNKNLGSRTVTINQYLPTTKKVWWTNVTSSNYHYFIITKGSSGYAASGAFKISN